MSKFGKLINQEGPQDIIPTISPVGFSLGGQHLEKTLSCMGEVMSGSSYLCAPVECEAMGSDKPCGNPVGYVIHPSYDIHLGKDDKDIPIDLVFTLLPSTFRQKGTFKTTSPLLDHDHASGDAHEVICNKCGAPYHFFKSKFGGLVIPMGVTDVSIKIPKNRVVCITTPPRGYESAVK